MIGSRPHFRLITYMLHYHFSNTCANTALGVLTLALTLLLGVLTVLVLTPHSGILTLSLFANFHSNVRSQALILTVFKR